MYAKVLFYISQVVKSKSTTAKETSANNMHNLSLHNWDYFQITPFLLFWKLKLTRFPYVLLKFD